MIKLIINKIDGGGHITTIIDLIDCEIELVPENLCIKNLSEEDNITIKTAHLLLPKDMLDVKLLDTGDVNMAFIDLNNYEIRIIVK